MKDDSRFFKRILESQPGLMVFTLDKKYRYTYFTETHQKVMQSFWGKMISIGDNMLEVVTSPSVRKSAKNSFDKALKGKSFTQVKSYLIDGKYYYIENHYAPTRNANGKIIGVTDFAIDITRSQTIENEIEQSHSLLETTINSSTNGILVVDRDGKTVLFNRKFLELMEIPPALAKIKNDSRLLADVIPKLKDGEAFLDRVNHLYANPGEQSRDLMEFKDGRVYARYSAPQKIKNKIIGRVWSFLDITEQQNAERELRYRENRYRTLQEASFGGIGLHDKGVILDANFGLSELTGYSLDELVGMNGINLIAPEYRTLVLERITSGYSEAYDVIGLKKDGSRYYLEVRGKSFHSEGKTLRVSEFRDITERKLAEEKIREQNARLASIAQSLRKKNDQLEEFTQIVSHNLRSPVGNISALLDHYEKSSDILDREEMIRYMKKTAESLLLTMQELNEILKVGQTGPIEVVELEFSKVLDKVLAMLHTNIVNQKAFVEQNFDVKKILYSPLYLESIFLNLISNALKYSSPARSSVIRVRSFLKEGATMLEVEDNGVGIDMNRFGHQVFKLRKTFHDHPDSRGIGLFMVKNQVEAMGGEINVVSEVEKGCTFTIHFGKQTIV